MDNISPSETIKSLIIVAIIALLCVFSIYIPREAYIYLREHSNKYDCASAAFLDTVIGTGFSHNKDSERVICIFHFFDGEVQRDYKIIDNKSYILPKGFAIPIRYQHNNPEKVIIDHQRKILYKDSLVVFINRNIWSDDVIEVLNYEKESSL